jgi:alkylhydroperoxidase family enzyme
MTAVQHLYKAMYASGVAPSTLELVHMRASQVNACSASSTPVSSRPRGPGSVLSSCSPSALGPSPRCSPRPSAPPCPLTEAATRLADNPGAVTDETWNEAAKHFDDSQLNGLVLMIATTNFFNRINTTLRVPAGTRWS